MKAAQSPVVLRRKKSSENKRQSGSTTTTTNRLSRLFEGVANYASSYYGTQDDSFAKNNNVDPITKRINEIFEELKPEETQPVSRRHVRAMNTVSGYFGDWTRWLNKTGGGQQDETFDQSEYFMPQQHEYPYFSSAALINTVPPLYNG